MSVRTVYTERASSLAFSTPMQLDVRTAMATSGFSAFTLVDRTCAVAPLIMPRPCVRDVHVVLTAAARVTPYPAVFHVTIVAVPRANDGDAGACIDGRDALIEAAPACHREVNGGDGDVCLGRDGFPDGGECPMACDAVRYWGTFVEQALPYNAVASLGFDADNVAIARAAFHFFVRSAVRARCGPGGLNTP